MRDNQNDMPWGAPRPWRISADDIDDAIVRCGVDPYHVEITLDGVLATMVITADEECGLIEQQKCDSNGQPITDGDEFLREIRYGDVEIILKSRRDGSWPHLGQRRPDKTERV